MMITLLLQSSMLPFTVFVLNVDWKPHPDHSPLTLYFARLYVTLEVFDYSAPPGLCVRCSASDNGGILTSQCPFC